MDEIPLNPEQELALVRKQYHELEEKVFAFLAIVHRDAGYHTCEVGFEQSWTDAMLKLGYGNEPFRSRK